ncbi:MAG: hypothetical protein LBH16_11205 [Treponema sp.]|jgi:hypothetical protein|nr:hypothetical protein [Treponema sp.]
MKKLGFIIAVVAIVAFAGCASGGKSSAAGSSAGGGEPYSVDLSTLTQVLLAEKDAIGETVGKGILRNQTPFPKNYADLMFIFDEFPVDVTQYQRITIKCKYFNEAGEEIPAGDTNAMVVLVYDIDGDKRGPAMDAGPNTPLKEMNLMGYSGVVSTDKGSRSRLTKAPGGILFQNSNAGVKFIEVTEITWHN